MSSKFHAAFFAATSVAVALAVAWGFYLVGSPTTRRHQRFDQQRLEDLQTIAREIHALVVDREDATKLKQPLPESLAEAAKRALDERLNARDPQTGEPYGYTVKSETTYELCAKFSRERNWDSPVFWNHPPGRHCFTINVLDPPPY
jgi:hypothetical protein